MFPLKYYTGKRCIVNSALYPLSTGQLGTCQLRSLFNEIIELSVLVTAARFKNGSDFDQKIIKDEVEVILNFDPENVGLKLNIYRV